MMTDWDASRYHRISDPQFEWGRRVLARLAPAAGERILDLGCGTGRLTQEILASVGRGLVVGLDRSRAMLSVAGTPGGSRPGRIAYIQADGAALPFLGGFDAVFSAATLHWIPDHRAVFGGVFRALRPAGRFVAQCGGAGNLDRLVRRAGRLMSSPPFAPYFQRWQDPWEFADAQTTARRLEACGFVDVRTWIEEANVFLAGERAFAEFVACVCLRHHLDRLATALRDPFVAALTDTYSGDAVPFTLDYQRLNISARKVAD